MRDERQQQPPIVRDREEIGVTLDVRPLPWIISIRRLQEGE
jgi:hypothetical protein